MRLFFRDTADKTAELDAAAFKAALRVKLATVSAGSGALAAKLCAKAVEKIVGLAPARAEIELWNGRSFFLGVPADIGGFLSDLHGIVLENQYAFEDFRNAVVIDAGANIGMFSLYAGARGAARVYAFEPVRETWEMLRRNIAASGLGKIVFPFNAALGERPARSRISFNTRGEGSAMIKAGNRGVNIGVGYEKTRVVEVLPLDDVVRRRTDLIKIDVEGCEKKVLLGAARLIKKYKPVLSFAAYHRPSDRRTLPDVVLGLRKDYGVTLNTFAEHDLYCE